MWCLVTNQRGSTGAWLRWGIAPLVLLLVAVAAWSAPQTGLECPAREFTLVELSGFLQRDRSQRSALPAPFASQEMQLKRQRCLYVLFEYELENEKKTGRWQSFTYDFYGELMGFYAPPN